MATERRKSSYSGGVNDEVCVEVAGLPEGVGVRDSKLPAAGHLTFSPAGFSALLSSLKRDAIRS